MYKFVITTIWSFVKTIVQSSVLTNYQFVKINYNFNNKVVLNLWVVLTNELQKSIISFAVLNYQLIMNYKNNHNFNEYYSRKIGNYVFDSCIKWSN